VEAAQGGEALPGATFGGLPGYVPESGGSVWREPLADARPPAARLRHGRLDGSQGRLHQALFVRESGSRHVHATDPLLYRGSSTFLLDGERHRAAVARPDEFRPVGQNPLKRLVLQ
jgi:hypothetical protein